MSAPTGVDARGFRYLIGVWPERKEFIAVSLVKIYATGGREGVIGIVDTGPDLQPVIQTVNDAVRSLQKSENFPPRNQPDGFGVLDELPVLRTLKEGEPVGGAGWEELDDAAVQVYGGTRPAHWPPPGEPSVMRYQGEPAAAIPPARTPEQLRRDRKATIVLGVIALLAAIGFAYAAWTVQHPTGIRTQARILSCLPRPIKQPFNCNGIWSIHELEFHQGRVDGATSGDIGHKVEIWAHGNKATVVRGKLRLTIVALALAVACLAGGIVVLRSARPRAGI